MWGGDGVFHRMVSCLNVSDDEMFHRMSSAASGFLLSRAVQHDGGLVSPSLSSISGGSNTSHESAENSGSHTRCEQSLWPNGFCLVLVVFLIVAVAG